MAIFGPIQGLGTIWYFDFFDETFDTKVASVTTQLMREFEARYSRFQPHSWLSSLNSEKVFHKPDPEFVKLLNESLRYYQETDGVFNIAVGEKMEAIGYDANYSLHGGEVVLPENPNLTEVLNVADDKITLLYGKLDLGGIGKGFLIDKLANFFHSELGFKYFLINGGGDIYATSKCGEAVEIQLAHPLDKSKYIATVKLHNQGFAASSPYLRAWTDPKTGVKYNHLHTNNDIASYVVANDTTQADVYATTLAINPDVKHHVTLKKLLLQGEHILTKDHDFHLN